jgi:replicative DNA helicase
VEYYAHIVRERAIRRELITAGTSIVQMAHEPAYDVAEVVQNAEKSVYAVAEKRIAQDFLPLKKVLNSTFGRLEAIYEGKGGIVGVPTGFRDLDDITGGLQRSNLIIIAARPSMGKTAFAMNIAQHVSRQNTPVAVFSMEMSSEELGARILSSEARIEGDRLKNGRLHESDWANLAKVMSQLNNVPLYIDDSSGLTVMEIASKARKLSRNHGLGMVMIDYIQLISGPMRKEANRVQELAEISRQLKFLAKELKIPVIALSQLARGVETRNDKRPMLSDLRDSGAIEQEADLVVFIYRDEYYNPHSDQQGIAEIIIAKQRSGRTGKIELHFSNQYVKFENLARMHGM